MTQSILNLDYKDKRNAFSGRSALVQKNKLNGSSRLRSGKKELAIIKKQKHIKNFIFVVGIQKDKDSLNMLNTINPLISVIIFTKSKNEKAENPENLLKIFNKINKNKKIKTRTIQNPKNALNYARKIADKRDLVVVAGSIYLVGDLL